MSILGIGGVTILWVGLTLMIINHSRGASGESTQAYVWLAYRGWYAYLLYLVYQFGIRFQTLADIVNTIMQLIGGIL